MDNKLVLACTVLAALLSLMKLGEGCIHPNEIDLLRKLKDQHMLGHESGQLPHNRHLAVTAALNASTGSHHDYSSIPQVKVCDTDLHNRIDAKPNER